MYFFKKLGQYWGTFAKKKFDIERSKHKLKGQNTKQIFGIAKNGEKWQRIGVPPIYHPNFFFPK